MFLILILFLLPIHVEKLNASQEQHLALCPFQKHSQPQPSHYNFPKGWRDPKQKISPPSPLVGTQMGSVETLGIPPLGYKLDGKIKIFELIAQPVEKIITSPQKPSWHHLIPEKDRADDLRMKMKVLKTLEGWGYNGSIPGPTIEAVEGDRIRIIVKNELPEPTTIHWHGIELPNKEDGAGGITQRPIMPGDTFTYEFTLYQSGTFLYHSGFNMTKQDQMGLAGMFVIHPKEPEARIDKDVAIMLQEWALPPGNPHPNLTTMEFNWATFNALTAPKLPHISAKQGDRVRLRFSNMSMNSHPIHLHGFTWQEVGTEGGPIPKSARRPGNTINVPPGTTRDVEFVAWNPGIWRMHCHKIHHIMNAHTEVPLGVMPPGGMFTVLYVEPTEPKAPWKHPLDDGNKT